MLQFRLRPLLWLLSLVISQSAGCGTSVPSITDLESRVARSLQLKSVSLQPEGDAVFQGRGVSQSGIAYRIKIKRDADDKPWWFHAEDPAGNRIMGPCEGSVPHMSVANVLA